MTRDDPRWLPSPACWGDEIADGEQKQLVKHAKDLSAGAVLVSALTALVIGILFLLIPFVQRMLDLIQGR